MATNNKHFMKKLKSLFRKEIGSPIPQEILLDELLVPLDGNNEADSLLWGTKIALGDSYLFQGQIDDFMQSCPEGYFLIGFWGHGVNSYAFYYSRVDNWKKILFRLPYGGVYTDNKLMAKQIREFLANYIEFEQSLAPAAKSLIAIDSMEEGYYKIVMNDGKTIEMRESFFSNPNFKSIFDSRRD
jgi:hypothetical protein